MIPRKTVVHYREVLVKEKIKAFRINESVLEAFRIILSQLSRNSSPENLENLMISDTMIEVPRMAPFKLAVVTLCAGLCDGFSPINHGKDL